MAPSGLAILIGAGPATGAGIARILAHPSHGNFAVALLARNPDKLSSLTTSLRSSAPNSIIESFPTDASSPSSITETFTAIRTHPSFQNLKLRLGVYNVKNPSKKPFLEETHPEFTAHLNDYVGGAFAFSQEFLKLLFEHHGDAALADGGEKKGTLVFTGTNGALRTNANFAAYGAARSGVRMLAQSMARELSEKGVHVVHAIANGSIEDAQGEKQSKGQKMSAEAVGKTYLWLSGQGAELWTHELDMRPAGEKF